MADDSDLHETVPTPDDEFDSADTIPADTMPSEPDSSETVPVDTVAGTDAAHGTAPADTMPPRTDLDSADSLPTGAGGLRNQPSTGSVQLWWTSPVATTPDPAQAADSGGMGKYSGPCEPSWG